MLLSFGCGGNLSDEQRKKFREGMEEQKIVRVTDAEIMSGALEKGHEVIAVLNRKKLTTAQIDSLEQAENVRISYAVPGEANAIAVEQELIEAYIVSMTTGSAQENLQRVYATQQKDVYDTLLYSRPDVSQLPDGSEQLNGIWNIYIPKKQVVLTISKTK